MANVIDYKNTETGVKKSKKQQRRQSRDFKEIWNVQSEMDVTDDNWDQMFHNWDNPNDCNQNRPHKSCAVCNQLKKNGFVIRKTTGKKYINEI